MIAHTFTRPGALCPFTARTWPANGDWLEEARAPSLEHLVRSRNLTQVLCFMRTKHGASRLARQLEKDGLITDAIHGDKSQQARMEALDRMIWLHPTRDAAWRGDATDGSP